VFNRILKATEAVCIVIIGLCFVAFFAGFGLMVLAMWIGTDSWATHWMHDAECAGRAFITWAFVLLLSFTIGYLANSIRE
jgi:hypothetical protein